MKLLYKFIPLAVSIFFLVTINKVYAQCHDPKLNVVILGSGGPEMNDGRASSSYLLRKDTKALFLIDFGGGASLNFERSKANIDDLKAVLFTHFHVDHTADFPALVKAYYFQSRQTDLPILGPSGNEIMPSLTTWLQDLFGEKQGAYHYLSEFVDNSDSNFKLVPVEISADRKNTSIFNKTIAGYKISAIAVTHGPIPALAYRIDMNGCSVTFSGDTSNQTKTLEKLAINTDLLIAHNAVPESSQDKIALNLHMPPSEIGRIAAKANVKKVVLSHFMQRTELVKKATLKAIRKRFNGPVFFAQDLDVYSLDPN